MEKKNKKILLAEDDNFISTAYSDGLSRAGFNVMAARDGDEALAKAGAEKFDLILLDIIMPAKNGFEVLEMLKNNLVTKDIPVVIMSNLGQDTDIERGKKLGAIDYLIKANYSMKEVVEKINGYLQ